VRSNRRHDATLQQVMNSATCGLSNVLVQTRSTVQSAYLDNDTAILRNSTAHSRRIIRFNEGVNLVIFDELHESPGSKGQRSRSQVHATFQQPSRHRSVTGRRINLKPGENIHRR